MRAYSPSFFEPHFIYFNMEGAPLAAIGKPNLETPLALKPGAPIVYLLSQFPTLTHTYLLREIVELRKSGLNIHVASVRLPDRPVDAMGGIERNEAELAFYVKFCGFWKSLSIHLRFLVRHPLRWFRGFLCALRLSRSNPGKLVNNLFYFAEAIIVGCWMETKQSSHLHTHFVSTVALLIKKVFPVTYSMTIHGPEEFDDAVGFHLNEKMAAADFVFAISYYSQSQLMRASHSRDWHKIRVIPLGIHPSTYRPSPRPGNEDTFRLICVARLAPVKAQLILIQAVAKLVKAGHKIELHLVGGGIDREQLETKTNELGLTSSVVFHGGVPQARVIELLGTAHAFALASFAEGVPVALMEAMALEVPCIATCIMGIPELIRDRLDGLLVPPSDIDGLSGAIEELIRGPELRKQLGKSGRQHVIERYNIEQNIQTMLRYFEGASVDNR